MDENLEYLEDFGESIWDWHEEGEDPLSSSRAEELLVSAERLTENGVKRSIEAKRGTWIVIPHRETSVGI